MVLVNILWCLATIVISGLVYILWFQKYSRFYKLLNEIPGAKGYPIIGTPLTYLNVAPEKLFAHAHEAINKYYPISKDWSFTLGCVHLLHPDDIEVVLASTQNNDKGLMYYLLEPWLGSGLLTSPKSKWLKRRKILTPAFHFKILQGFIHIFNRETATFVEALKKECVKPFTEVTSVVTEYTLNSIAETAMGIELDQSKKCKDYKKAIYQFGESLVYRLMRPWYYPYPLFSLCPSGWMNKAAVGVLHDFSNNVIKERKKNFSSPLQNSNSNKKRLALLDLMLKAQEDGEDIDDEGIREEVDTFMFEGHDTAAMAISSFLLLMANNQDVQEKLHEEVVHVLGDKIPTFDDFKELLYMEMCVREGLRLFPSVHAISRMATCDIKLPSGYTIPKNAIIGIHTYDVHRNPEFWPDPEKYDPERFLPEAVRDRHPYAYLPFSAGQRNCIGQKFAMLEIKAVLCGVLRKYRLEPVEAPSDLTMGVEMILRPIEGYKVRIRPR